MNNTHIKLNRNLSYKEAECRAKRFLRLNENFVNGYIFIECPGVSDLFVVENRELRANRDEEWANYFKTYLYPNKK